MRRKMISFRFISSLLIGVLQGTLGLGTAWLLKLAADIVTGANTVFSFLDFSILAGAYYLIYIILYWFSKKTYAGAMKEFRTKVKERLSKGLIWQSERDRQKTRLGEVVSRFQYQVDAMERLYYAPLHQTIKNSVTMAIFLGASLYLQWQITMISLAAFACFQFLTRQIQKTLNDYQEKIVQSGEREARALVDLVHGFHTARDCRQEDFFLKRYRESADMLAQTNFKCEFLYDILSSISVNLEPIMTLLVIILGGMMLQSGTGNLKAGDVLGLTQLIASVLGPIGEFAPGISQMRSAAALRKAFRDYEATGIRGRAIWREYGKALPALEKITLRDVSFSYEDKCSEEDGEERCEENRGAHAEMLLEHVNLELFYGRKYAIIGESGSGKTSLLRLILKLVEPSGGDLYWNDIPYDEVGKAGILREIAYVAQTPTVFHKDIKSNIIAGRKEDAHQLNAVMRKSRMNGFRGGKGPEDILILPADELSGGEKKRLAYARALYRDGQILILDEFTSAVDEAMAEDLESEMLKGDARLVIHVTHTLSQKNMALYDAVFSVQDGRVVRVDECIRSGSS